LSYVGKHPSRLKRANYTKGIPSIQGQIAFERFKSLAEDPNITWIRQKDARGAPPLASFCRFILLLLWGRGESKKNILRLACKPHSVLLKVPVYARRLRPGLFAWTVISLCSLPGIDHEASSFSSLLGLAPGGGCLAARIAADAGGLLHHLFTLTALRRRSVSVALIRQVSPSRGFPGAVLSGVRTFLDPSPKLGAATVRPA